LADLQDNELRQMASMLLVCGGPAQFVADRTFRRVGGIALDEAATATENGGAEPPGGTIAGEAIRTPSTHPSDRKPSGL
jgi:hypothetical protein